jgi:hypothetical protein
LSAIAEAFFDRVRDGLANRSSLGRVSAWLPKHTRMNGRPFSFVDHEFQIAIADSTHHDVVVKKPSQVGLTELIARQSALLGRVSVELEMIHILENNINN